MRWPAAISALVCAALMGCGARDGAGPDDTGAAAIAPTCAPLEMEITDEWGEGDLPVIGSPSGIPGGVAIGDLDGDGWSDAFFAYGGGSFILRNVGAGAMEIDQSMHAGEWPMPPAGAVALADLDGDGDLDAWLGRVRQEDDLILINDGAGVFTQTAIPNSGAEPLTGSFADIDGDGDLDLFVATLIEDIDLAKVMEGEQLPDPNALYLNEGGTFVEANDRLPEEVIDTWGFQGSWADFDLDGDLDLYLANDFGAFFVPNKLLLNDGSGHFTAAEGCFCELEMYGMGAAVGDPNEDGWPDVYVTNIGQNALLLNMQDGTFVDAALSAGAVEPTGTESLTSWSTAFFDVNQDTYEDLAMMFGVNNLPDDYIDALDVNDEGWISGVEQPDVLYLGGPDGAFERFDGFADPSKGRGLAVGDLDRDGRPDLITVGKSFLKTWRTSGGCEPGIQLTLDGPVGNSQGIGARVEVDLGERRLTRWMLPSTTGGQSEAALYLGLGGRASADRITVTWPDGTVWSEDDVAAGPLQVAR